MSEDKEEYVTEELGLCDVCMWYGVQRKAVRAVRDSKYPRAMMQDVALQGDPTRTKRQRVPQSYSLCDEHYDTANQEHVDNMLKDWLASGSRKDTRTIHMFD